MERTFPLKRAVRGVDVNKDNGALVEIVRREPTGCYGR